MSKEQLQVGPNFFVEGRKQFQGHLIIENPAESIIGDLTASDAVLVAMATGMNVALIGEPGGGKSVLSSDCYRIVDGIEPDDVAKVPHTADLTAERLIGSSGTTVKSVTRGSESATEEISSQFKPLLHPDTKAIWLDEINRVSPFAINGVLGALENGKVITDAGILTLHGLEWAISTMNPHNHSHSTFQLDPAVVSRHAIAMVLGDEDSHKALDAADPVLDGLLMDNWVAEPEKVEPVVTLDGLHAIRNIVDNLRIAENQRPLVRQLVSNMLSKWREVGVFEAKGRAAMQFSRIGRGLGVLRNEEPKVTEKDLRDAAILVSCARLAMGARLEYSDLQQSLTSIADV